jgi:hypothetical protein
MMGGTRMLNNHMHLRELKKPNGTRNEGEMMEFRAQMLAEGGSPGPPCRGMPNRAAYLSTTNLAPFVDVSRLL